ncbi:hypothetical protein GZH47_32980 (plasmid) [Paenibacillus rhizovicinus]|uniref:Uncharacterized protein n=1 Tax=Paenibacillus rhizovicinus TaxID=2704463 RepID=A0A6C0PB51_9BACL|nr:hypothetical protein [Paenibacillus rhizovicinus]QHW35709.1 hypothetical protein GZH47_32980 [Paenibacillus rhizovicinus]
MDPTQLTEQIAVDDLPFSDPASLLYKEDLEVIDDMCVCENYPFCGCM